MNLKQLALFPALLVAGLLLGALAGAPAGAEEPLRGGSLQAAPGEKVSGHLRVPLADGDSTEIPVSIVNGTVPGPVLALVAGAHGTEYTPILALQQLLQELDPAAIQGAVILVHMANPLAFFTRRLTEGNPDDLSEQYPGDPEGTPSERIAWKLAQEVVHRATHLIDMHAGGGNQVLESYAYLVVTGDSVLDATSRAMALAYGMDQIMIWTGMYADEQPHLAGVRSVMAHLGMIEGDVLVPGEPLFFGTSEEVRAEHSGLWNPLVSVRQIVEEGSLPGRLTDPFENVLEEVRAPYRGEVHSVVGPPPVNAGEAVVFIGRLPGNGH